jgi:hypothetical protein
VIAGDAAKSSASETLAYVRALRETGCIGGSMYDWATTNARDWVALTNGAREPHADAGDASGGRLPAPPSATAPASTRIPRRSSTRRPARRAARAQLPALRRPGPGEVRLLVNWKTVAMLPAGPDSKKWTTLRSLTIPAAIWSAGGANVIGFVAKGDFGAWSVWGVRAVTVTVPAR